jgi:O-antigen/teichoic acid export membrane protein
VILNIVFVPRFGLVGAAAATGIAMTLNAAVLALAVRRFVTIQIDRTDVAWCGLAGAGMAALLLGLKTVVAPSSLPMLAGFVALGAGVYVVGVMSSTSLRTKAVEMVHQVV